MRWRARWRGRLAAGLAGCALAVLLAVAPRAVAAPERAEELLLGIEPEHNIFDQVERYRALTEYLSGQLGVKVKITIMSRYGEVLKRFKILHLDGAFLTPYTAAMAINRLDLEPVANPVNLNGKSTSHGLLFARKDRLIEDIKDMEGKSIALVDPATLEGYLFPLLYLKHQGVKDRDRFFKRITFAGSHASVVFAVLDGRADLGAAKDTVFERMVRNDPSVQQELKVIAQSPEFPEITLCLSRDIDQKLREKMRAALLDMDKTPHGQAVLKKFAAIRFISSSREDFDRIEGMVREIGAAGLKEHGNGQ